MISRLLQLAKKVWPELGASTLLRLLNQLLTAALIVFPAWVLSRKPDISLLAVAIIMALIAQIGRAHV